MKYLKNFISFNESTSHIINEVRFPDLDITEQLEFLYDILGKNNVKITTKYYSDIKNPNFNEKFFSTLRRNLNSISPAYFIHIDNIRMEEDVYDKTKPELEEFCKHLQETVSDKCEVVYKIRNAGQVTHKKLQFWVYLISKEKISIGHMYEEFSKALRAKISDKYYEIKNLTKDTLYYNFEINVKGIIFNNGVKEHIEGLLDELKDSWNFKYSIKERPKGHGAHESTLDKHYCDGYYIKLLYPDANQIKNQQIFNYAN